jgi:hypothetical protein
VIVGRKWRYSGVVGVRGEVCRVVVWKVRIGNQRGRGIEAHMYRPLFFSLVLRSSNMWSTFAVAGYAGLMQW